MRMQEDKLQQLHREKVRGGRAGTALQLCFGPQHVRSVAAHAGDGAAVSQSGAERAERLRRCSRAEPGAAEGRPAERPAEHLQGAVQSQRGESPPPARRVCRC